MLESNPSYITTIRKELPGYKRRAKKAVQAKVLEASQEQARGLELQGEFARLLEEQESNVDWQALIYSLPRGLLGFAARLTSNSLPSPDNLARWQKLVCPTCPLCGITPCTLFHLLNNCKTSLDQDRYDYRHDSILSYLYSIVRKAKEQGNLEIYCDLAGSRVNGVTIPNDIIITDRKPDLVIINRSSKNVDLVELTIP